MLSETFQGDHAIHHNDESTMANKVVSPSASPRTRRKGGYVPSAIDSSAKGRTRRAGSPKLVRRAMDAESAIQEAEDHEYKEAVTAYSALPGHRMSSVSLTSADMAFIACKEQEEARTSRLSCSMVTISGEITGQGDASDPYSAQDRRRSSINPFVANTRASAQMKPIQVKEIKETTFDVSNPFFSETKTTTAKLDV